MLNTLDYQIMQSKLQQASFGGMWKSPVCVTPEAQVLLTLESKFRMTPIKS